MARLAGTVDALSAISGLKKLAWETLQLECDPYQYNSFPMNAGSQIWKLTQRIDDQLADLAKQGGATGLPKILAFQSMADATVSPAAVVKALYGRLPDERHRLGLSDSNPVGNDRGILKPKPFAARVRLDSQGRRHCGRARADRSAVAARILLADDHALVLRDAFPVSPGHTRIIPRYAGDREDPRSGIRRVILEKAHYRGGTKQVSIRRFSPPFVHPSTQSPQAEGYARRAFSSHDP